MAARLPISRSTRRKLGSIAVAMVIFAVLAALATAALGRPLEFSVTNAIMTGIGVGLFEEFYVQTLRGRWLRAMHPLASILIYAVVVVAIYLVALHLSHLFLGHWAQLPVVYERLPEAIPMFIAFSAIGIGAMRVVHFIGAENLFHLTVGTYHRPVARGVVLLFADINGSTAIAGQLGAVRMSSLVQKFLFDVARPITNLGGEIYVYKGDGLIAAWYWNEAVRDNTILRAVDGMFAALRREEPIYRREFGIVPTFRVGVHGGEVVVSEQGDTRRSIGIYGDTINIAARMEDAAKAHDVACVLSEDVAKALDNRSGRIQPLGAETIRGLDAPFPICAYRPDTRDEAASLRPVAVATPAFSKPR